MKLKPVKISEIMTRKNYGEQLDGVIVFSNLGKKDMDSISLEQFGQLDKTNLQSELDITKGGNDPNDPLDLTICNNVGLSKVKLANLPLDGIDLFDYKPHKSRKTTSEDWDIFLNILKHTKKPIEIENEDEGFLEEFYIGNGTIEPEKTKYPEYHPKFDTPTNENIRFDMNIDGCHIIYHSETPSDNLQKMEDNINDIKKLFRFTIIPEINLKFRTQRRTKEVAKLDHQITEILTGKRKKLPAKLFDKLEYHNFRDNDEKKPLFIASLKDDILYQFED